MFKTAKDGCSVWEAFLTPNLIGSKANGFAVDALKTGLSQSACLKIMKKRYNIQSSGEFIEALCARLAQQHEKTALFDSLSSSISQNYSLYASLDDAWHFKASITEGLDATDINGAVAGLLAGLEKLEATEFFNSVKDFSNLSAIAFFLDNAITELRLAHSCGWISEDELLEQVNKAYYLTVSHYSSWREFCRGYLAGMACCGEECQPALAKAMIACLYEISSPWVKCEVFKAVEGQDSMQMPLFAS